MCPNLIRIAHLIAARVRRRVERLVCTLHQGFKRIVNSPARERAWTPSPRVCVPRMDLPEAA